MRGLLALAGFAAVAAWSTPAASQSDHVAEAGALFERRCASCHALPDPALRTDRAWLERVRDTA
jgi:hypothetical protein